MHAIEVLARYASEFNRQQLTTEVLHHAKRAVIDWYASLFPGLATEPVQLLERSARRRPGSWRRVAWRGPPRHRASRRADQRHVCPRRRSGRQFSRRDVPPGRSHDCRGARGGSRRARLRSRSSCAAWCRLRSVHPHRRRDGPTALQVLAQHRHSRYLRRCRSGRRSPAAATRAAFAHALGNRGTFAAGLQQAFRMDSMSKPLHAGRAAEAGVLAALLARQRDDRIARHS